MQHQFWSKVSREWNTEAMTVLITENQNEIEVKKGTGKVNEVNSKVQLDVLQEKLE